MNKEEKNEGIENAASKEIKEEENFSTSLILLGVMVFVLIIVFSIFRFS